MNILHKKLIVLTLVATPFAYGDPVELGDFANNDSNSGYHTLQPTDTFQISGKNNFNMTVTTAGDFSQDQDTHTPAVIDLDISNNMPQALTLSIIDVYSGWLSNENIADDGTIDGDVSVVDGTRLEAKWVCVDKNAGSGDYTMLDNTGAEMVNTASKTYGKTHTTGQVLTPGVEQIIFTSNTSSVIGDITIECTATANEDLDEYLHDTAVSGNATYKSLVKFILGPV